MQKLANRWRQNLRLLILICGTMALVHIVNVVLQGYLLRFALVPREVNMLWGIVGAPFLHGSATHLLSNLAGLSIFGLLCMSHSRRYFIQISLFVVLLSGLLVWIFGRHSMHIGASGWVFGLWSACIAIAWVDRSFWNIFVAIVVVFFYGGMIYGVLPSDPRISFEFHLAGAIAGVIGTLLLVKRRR